MKSASEEFLSNPINEGMISQAIVGYAIYKTASTLRKKIRDARILRRTLHLLVRKAARI